MDEVLVTGLEKLIGFLESASPELWRILVKQAMVSGIQYVIGAIACAVIAAVCIRGLSRVSDSDLDSWDQDFLRFGLWIFTTITIPLGIIFAINAIGVLYNPEYHAIKGILEILR